MKTHLMIYGLLVMSFVAYNAFFQVEDVLSHEVINIIFASVLFLYIAIIAWKILKRIQKVSKN